MEEAWHPLRLKKHPLANLAKGFINGAIAFEHLKRDSKNAHEKAKRVMESYERHKHLCGVEIEHYVLFEEAKHKIEALKVKHTEVFSCIWYHATTKHSYNSVRTNPNQLSWEDQPSTYKNYPDSYTKIK